MAVAGEFQACFFILHIPFSQIQINPAKRESIGHSVQKTKAVPSQLLGRLQVAKSVMKGFGQAQKRTTLAQTHERCVRGELLFAASSAS